MVVGDLIRGHFTQLRAGAAQSACTSGPVLPWARTPLLIVHRQVHRVGGTQSEAQTLKQGNDNSPFITATTGRSADTAL